MLYSEAPSPAMPPLGPPRRDEAEDTIPPPTQQPTPFTALAAPAFEIAPEPTVQVSEPPPADPSRTDETVPGRGKRSQSASHLPWTVTGAGAFVLLMGAIVTLAANSLKGLVIMFLGLGAIAIGGQLGQSTRPGPRG